MDVNSKHALVTPLLYFHLLTHLLTGIDVFVKGWTSLLVLVSPCLVCSLTSLTLLIPGFSYQDSDTSADGNGKTWNEEDVAADMLQFLHQWMRENPSYKALDFYLMGESYAGHYIPNLRCVDSCARHSLCGPTNTHYCLLAIKSTAQIRGPRTRSLT
jgi:hypothetical protein